MLPLLSESYRYAATAANPDDDFSHITEHVSLAESQPEPQPPPTPPSIPDSTTGTVSAALLLKKKRKKDALAAWRRKRKRRGSNSLAHIRYPKRSRAANSKLRGKNGRFIPMPD